MNKRERLEAEHLHAAWLQTNGEWDASIPVMARHMVNGEPTTYSLRLLVDYLQELRQQETRLGEWQPIP